MVMSYSKLTILPKNKSNTYHKIYFIAGCFPPFGRGNSITNSCIANHLSKYFSIDVVCIDRKDGGLISYQEDQSLKKGINSKIKVNRINDSDRFGLNQIFYIIGFLPCYFLNWALNVWRKKDLLFTEPGIVFAVYPVFSDLIIAYLISRRFGYPLLVDFRDDFSGVMSRGWRKIFLPYYRLWEKTVIKKADKISVTTEDLKNDLISRYTLKSDKITVVYNVVPTLSLSKQTRQENKNFLSVVYAGAMSRVQKPEILLKAYKKLVSRNIDLKDILRVEFYGPESPYFRHKIQKYIVEGCHFGGFLPQAEVIQRVKSADIGFLSLSESTYAYATPTKLFDYIQTSTPIIACLPKGAARDIIENYQIGLVVDVDDENGLSEALQDLAENSELRMVFADNMKHALADFDTESQIVKWKKLLEDISN